MAVHGHRDLRPTKLNLFTQAAIYIHQLMAVMASHDSDGMARLVAVELGKLGPLRSRLSLRS